MACYHRIKKRTRCEILTDSSSEYSGHYSYEEEWDLLEKIIENASFDLVTENDDYTDLSSYETPNCSLVECCLLLAEDLHNWLTNLRMQMGSSQEPLIRKYFISPHLLEMQQKESRKSALFDLALDIIRVSRYRRRDDCCVDITESMVENAESLSHEANTCRLTELLEKIRCVWDELWIQVQPIDVEQNIEELIQDIEHDLANIDQWLRTLRMNLPDTKTWMKTLNTLSDTQRRSASAHYKANLTRIQVHSRTLSSVIDILGRLETTIIKEDEFRDHIEQFRKSVNSLESQCHLLWLHLLEITTCIEQKTLQNFDPPTRNGHFSSQDQTKNSTLLVFDGFNQRSTERTKSALLDTTGYRCNIIVNPFSVTCIQENTSTIAMHSPRQSPDPKTANHESGFESELSPQTNKQTNLLKPIITPPDPSFHIPPNPYCDVKPSKHMSEFPSGFTFVRADICGTEPDYTKASASQEDSQKVVLDEDNMADGELILPNNADSKDGHFLTIDSAISKEEKVHTSGPESGSVMTHPESVVRLQREMAQPTQACCTSENRKKRTDRRGRRHRFIPCDLRSPQLDADTWDTLFLDRADCASPKNHTLTKPTSDRECTPNLLRSISEVQYPGATHQIRQRMSSLRNNPSEVNRPTYTLPKSQSESLISSTDSSISNDSPVFVPNAHKLDQNNNPSTMHPRSRVNSETLNEYRRSTAFVRRHSHRSHATSLYKTSAKQQQLNRLSSHPFLPQQRIPNNWFDPRDLSPMKQAIKSENKLPSKRVKMATKRFRERYPPNKSFSDNSSDELGRHSDERWRSRVKSYLDAASKAEEMVRRHPVHEDLEVWLRRLNSRPVDGLSDHAPSTEDAASVHEENADQLCSSISVTQPSECDVKSTELVEIQEPLLNYWDDYQAPFYSSSNEAGEREPPSAYVEEFPWDDFGNSCLSECSPSHNPTLEDYVPFRSPVTSVALAERSDIHVVDGSMERRQDTMELSTTTSVLFNQKSSSLDTSFEVCSPSVRTAASRIGNVNACSVKQFSKPPMSCGIRTHPDGGSQPLIDREASLRNSAFQPTGLTNSDSDSEQGSSSLSTGKCHTLPRVTRRKRPFNCNARLCWTSNSSLDNLNEVSYGKPGWRRADLLNWSGQRFAELKTTLYKLLTTSVFIHSTKDEHNEARKQAVELMKWQNRLSRLVHKAESCLQILLDFVDTCPKLALHQAKWIELIEDGRYWLIQSCFNDALKRKIDVLETKLEDYQNAAHCSPESRSLVDRKSLGYDARYCLTEITSLTNQLQKMRRNLEKLTKAHWVTIRGQTMHRLGDTCISNQKELGTRLKLLSDRVDAIQQQLCIVVENLEPGRNPIHSAKSSYLKSSSAIPNNEHLEVPVISHFHGVVRHRLISRFHCSQIFNKQPYYVVILTGGFLILTGFCYILTKHLASCGYQFNGWRATVLLIKRIIGFDFDTFATTCPLRREKLSDFADYTQGSVPF